MKILEFGIVFVLVYIFYLLFVILRKKKLNKFKESQYVLMLKRTFGVEVDKLGNKYIANLVALANAFIIGVTVIVIGLVDGIIYKGLLAFASLTLLQIFIYYLLSKIMKRRIKKCTMQKK